jgi:methyltransferase
MTFTLFILFIILLRTGELILSKSNEKWLLQNGAVEYGNLHFKYIVSLHACFILSLFFEFVVRETETFRLLLVVTYIILIALKAWVILSLGKFWNTKIYRIPDVPPIKKGLYKYFKHPNYVIVALEIMIIPLTFGLYYTAFIFSVLNAVMLHVRIKEENRALAIREF